MTDRINYQARAPIPKGAKPTARYTYRDEQGHPLFQKHRYEWTEGSERHKAFRLGRITGYNRFEAGLNGARLVPYRLPELRRAIADGVAPIYVCEGEKDADNVVAAGGVATTNPLGAGKWRPEYAAY